MGYGSSYRISIEPLENGFKVEVPDIEEIQKKRAAAQKSKSPEPYIGDCMKSYAAKNVAEVNRLVSAALKSIPEREYDAAFEAAAKSKR